MNHFRRINAPIWSQVDVASTMRMPKAAPSYHHSLSPFPVLSSPAFNNLLKEELLESTPQNTMAEKLSYVMIFFLESGIGAYRKQGVISCSTSRAQL